MSIASEFILMALALAASSTVQDVAEDTCAGITTRAKLTAGAIIDTELPNGKKPTTTLPVWVNCIRTPSVYGDDISIEDCKIRKHDVFVRADISTCGAFLVEGQLYALFCKKGGGPKIQKLETEKFSKCVLAGKYGNDWHVEIPIDGAKQMTAMTVYFDRPDFNFEDFAKCWPFGMATHVRGVKAGSTGIIVKDKRTYELQCLKNDLPRIREADFLEEMCNGKKWNEAFVESSGDKDAEKPIKAMCVSFSCNKQKEITECKADCPKFGGGTKVGEAKVVTKDGKKFDFNCKPQEPPTIAFKKE